MTRTVPTERRLVMQQSQTVLIQPGARHTEHDRSGCQDVEDQRTKGHLRVKE